MLVIHHFHSDDIDHHANMRITHRCVNGVDLEIEFSSFEAKELTEKDFGAAVAVDRIHHDNPIRMSDFDYELTQDSIALFPAEPRGSSKLLRVDSRGEVSYFNHFGRTIPLLLDGCHIIFNNSRVLDARLLVELVNGNKVELMVSFSLLLKTSASRSICQRVVYLSSRCTTP